MSLLIATFPTTKGIARKIAKQMRAEYAEIFVEDFPDSEFHLVLRKNPKNKTVVIINSITKDPDQKLVETILAGGIAKDFGAKKVILVATYFPYLRQDAHFLKFDSLSAKHILRLFSHFDKIIAIDPHLHRIKRLRDLFYRAESISVRELIVKYIKNKFKRDFVIVGPDVESVQWSGPVARMLGKEVIVLKKRRLAPTNVAVKMRKIDQNNLNERDVIIIDDILSTGKTILKTIALARKQGARRIVVMGIHGLLIGDAGARIARHAELVTTNTILNPYAKIDVSPLIVKTLQHEI